MALTATAAAGSGNLTTPNPFLSRTTTKPPNHFKLFTLAKIPKPTTTICSVSSSTISSTTGPSDWAVDSWKSKTAHQLPVYPDPDELRTVLTTLETFPPIVFAGEARRLETLLGKAAQGEAFLLQGGDCAESFKEFNANNIRDTFRVFLQMAITLIYGAQMPVIKVRLFITLLCPLFED